MIDMTSPSATPEDVRRTLASRSPAGSCGPGSGSAPSARWPPSSGSAARMLRQALSILEEGGMIRRVPGRGGGTYVARGKIERDMSRIEGLPALLRSQGVAAGTHVLSARLAEPDDDAAQALRMRPGELAVDLLRLRLADGSPFCLEHARFPAKRFPGLLELPLGGSVYELLEEHFGTRPATAVERIEVTLASADEAAILDVEPDAALLAITRTASRRRGGADRVRARPVPRRPDAAGGPVR